MSIFLKSLVSLLLVVVAGVSAASDYQSWPTLNRDPKAKWYVDLDSVSKVGNSVLFDGVLRDEVNGFGFISGERILLSCSGRHYYKVASTWGWDLRMVRNGELTAALDLRRSLEHSGDKYEIAVSDRTASFRSTVQEMCKVRERPRREAMMIVSIAKDKSVELLRLYTHTRLPNGHVEVWSDDVKMGKEPQLEFSDSDWKQKIEPDGAAATIDVPEAGRTATMKYRYDCERNRFVLVSATVYNPNGTVKSSSQADEATVSRSWREVVPDSIGESALLAACSI